MRDGMFGIMTFIAAILSYIFNHETLSRLFGAAVFFITKRT
ncbi:MAG: hypothetical protein PHY67_03355 [Methanocorpusculum sp.]|nr:hypothetical protein [Methanocorpusculum sp.]